MYKVFKDNSLFILASSGDIPHIKEEFLTICISNIEDVLDVIFKHSDSEGQTIIIAYESKEELITAFENSLTQRIAAGGWVFNSNEELLVIDRLQHLDIPKGHLEEGETLEQCAIREVEEETGIRNISIVRELGISRHIFQYSKDEEFILKITHWYEMRSDFTGKFIAQKEEGVEQVFWLSKNELLNNKDKMWRSLWDFYQEKLM